jgi:hypothetical protein
MDKETKICLAKFIKFVKGELKVTSPFNVTITKTRSDKNLKTYAYYQPADGNVKIYAKNRGLADVLRSVAHELIHHQQNEKGMLDKPQPDIGGFVEDEANAVAGQFVKKFGYMNPKLAIYHKTL